MANIGANEPVASRIFDQPVAKPGGESLTKQYWYRQTADPFIYTQRAGREFWADPRIEQAQRLYDQQLYTTGQETGGFLKPEVAQLRGMAGGRGPSYVEQAAAGQRRQAQQAIGQQALMGSRGGMNPAAQRAAIMQASNVQSNMASQVAAARAQERMAALNQLMQARQAQLGAQQSMAQLRGQALGQQVGVRGGILATGQQALADRLNYATDTGMSWQDLARGYPYGVRR